MNGLPDQPWHAEAIRLDALGVRKEEIAELVDRSLQVVNRLLLPGVRAGGQRRNRARHHRLQADPEWRERQRLRYAAYRLRQKEARQCSTQPNYPKP